MTEQPRPPLLLAIILGWMNAVGAGMVYGDGSRIGAFILAVGSIIFLGLGYRWALQILSDEKLRQVKDD